jgi:L-2-hydroxyglutarate oxidase LhgO
LIVANGADQEAQLERLAESAVANGVEDLQWLGSAQVATLEPEISCTAALMSPSTGIVDSHALMTALLGEAEADGTVVAYKTAVERIDALTNGFAITLEGEGGAALVATRLINAAGLHAIQLAGKITGLPPEHVPKPYWAKGSYFALSGAAPFRRLIYPIPEPGGLGVHATIDLAGRVRFGPDVEWCETLEYGVEEARAESFYAKIRRYWPSLPDGALAPDYSGIRPKLSGPGEPAADFVISGPADHGLAGLVNLFGIESPGLTSALAIADEVEKRLAS